VNVESVFTILLLTDCQKNPYVSDKNFLTFTTLLLYLVKFEIQNMKFKQKMTSSFLPYVLIDCISANVSNRMFEMSSVSCNAGLQTHAPLPDCSVNHLLVNTSHSSSTSLTWFL